MSQYNKSFSALTLLVHNCAYIYQKPRLYSPNFKWKATLSSMYRRKQLWPRVVWYKTAQAFCMLASPRSAGDAAGEAMLQSYAAGHPAVCSTDPRNRMCPLAQYRCDSAGVTSCFSTDLRPLTRRDFMSGTVSLVRSPWQRRLDALPEKLLLLLC